MPPTPAGNPWQSSVDAPTTPPNLAVFAIPLATSLPFLAAILPLLPPITRNVTLPRAANRLEFGVRAEAAPRYNMQKRQKRQCSLARSTLPPTALFLTRAGGFCGRQALQARVHPPASWSGALSPLSPQGEEPGVRNPFRVARTE